MFKLFKKNVCICVCTTHCVDYIVVGVTIWKGVLKNAEFFFKKPQQKKLEKVKKSFKSCVNNL